MVLLAVGAVERGASDHGGRHDDDSKHDKAIEEKVLEGVPPRPEGLLRLGAAEDLQSRPTSRKRETRDDGSAKKF